MVDNSDIIEIIKLYRKFSKYNSYTDREIAKSIIPSLSLSQYKTHYENNKLIGFTNWAYVNKETELHFLKTGIIKRWNDGDIMLHVDFVATKQIKNIMKWLKNNAVKSMGLNKNIYWIRLNNNNTIRTIMEQKTKDSWSWVV
jgi:hemolysin-activating ACP:hemolysin acyltransferase